MIDTKHLLKVATAWIRIVYVVCYAGVSLIPGVRQAFLLYSLHSRMPIGESVLTLGTFISGLILWNIVALLAVWLFVALWNGIKR